MPGGAVLRIAADRVPDRLEVHADLVRAPRVQAQAQQRGALQRPLEREVGARLARTGTAHGHARAHAWVASDRRLDRARARRRAPLDEREVLALDPPLGERALQAPVDLLVARHHEQARGAAVEAVHDAGALGVPAGLVARQHRCEQLGERVLAVAARGVHDEAGSLVDDEQVRRPGRRS